MDTLSRLVELSHLQPTLDIRCRLEGTFHINHEPAQAGVLPFHLVLAGSCTIRLRSGEQIVLQAGDFLLFPRGSAHILKNFGNASEPAAPFMVSHEGILPLRQNGLAADVDLLCGHFKCAPGSSDLLLGSLPDPFHASLASLQNSDMLRTFVDLLRQETVLQQPGALVIVTGMCLCLLILALRTRDAAPDRMPGLLALLADPRLKKSVRAAMAAPGHHWTIEGLANLSAMSRATYARQFMARAGMTVGDFLAALRMSVASDLLRGTRRSIADIAAEVGYDSEAAFGKTFKAQNGVTPAKFRRRFLDGDF
ncbi:AraC family transcriptional regulator [Rhizobium calliandrae]|uniref:AraC family transcriptional regulator n=1 Tax=Rhizobium calliandrae TaxID=1312182 RepID=A0ABT7KGP9_9HYPH|nr:AraC family transcriptional regulator [Rhizobium calliandrae]MDL2407796.1 AraC family transcriptional regulator [Rhizobium calliandrae]